MRLAGTVPPEMPLIASAFLSTARRPTPIMQETALYLRIVIVSADPGAWSGMWRLPAAATVVYVREPVLDCAPDELRTLTYCETCEGA